MSSIPFTVKAVFEYTSEHEDDLTFSIGQVITVTEEEDAEWYYGQYTNDTGAKKEGIFPRNFVEKYDPPAPPRPSRPARVKKEPEGGSHVVASPSEQQPAPASPVEVGRKSVEVEKPEVKTEPVEPGPPVAVASPIISTSPSSTVPTAQSSQEAAPQVEVGNKEKATKKPPPPPVAEKPTGGSFRDRIAAFNKASAAPITPFNPNGPQSATNNAIRKPFVPPPPSKNAYVPPPVEKPQTLYQREEDAPPPDRPNEETLVADRPPPAETGELDDEGQPKPTLKERIALLQKQQLEQAARHADAAQKKDKPKKPPKKKTEPQESIDISESVPSAEPERVETSENTKEIPATMGQVEETGHHRHRSSIAPHTTSTQPPARELTSDTNDADNSGAGDTEEADETSTSREDLDEPPEPIRQTAPERRDSEKMGDSEKATEGEDEGESEEEMDPEIKRRMELRDRMAKISGGMGMMGMFGPPPAIPGVATGGFKKPKQPTLSTVDVEGNEQQDSSPTVQAAPVPVMAFPGTQSKKSQDPQQPATANEHEESPIAQSDNHAIIPDDSRKSIEQKVADNIESPVTGAPPEPSVPVHPPASTRPAPPPPVPDNHPALPPQPTEPRPVPTLPDHGGTPGGDVPVPASSEQPSKRQSQQSSAMETSVPMKPTVEKRQSLGHPPPLPPLASPPVPTQTRPPPPPPPAQVSRQSTRDSKTITRTPTQLSGNDSEEEVTEYDGDYDTDIASGAKHKDALKAHGRDSSFDESIMTDDLNVQSPKVPIEGRPPIPSTTAPRAAPPPPPTQPPKHARKSSDMPRIPPPPIPLPKTPSLDYDGDREGGTKTEYEPYRPDMRPNISPQDYRTDASTPAKTEPYQLEETSYFDPAVKPAPHSPPLPPSQPPASQAPRSGRQSIDLLRGQQSNVRRSMDVSRPSVDQGFIANDVDLGQGTLWWAVSKSLPPGFQNRRDILHETEESTANRDGQTMVSKDVYILFMDYSQTIVSVQFDSQNPTDAVLEQRHVAPPPRLRQDQLEDAHTQFGSRISEAVASKQNSTVGNGTPHVLVQSLLTPLSDALLPVGVRSYGALVYANLANASVQQFDEIRAGDIITFRNSRFQGHRGTMHQKYTSEVGKPDHVAVVVDWDGTKKKVRAWEQGRESKKVKMESFKLGDLKSGECRVWRVMPRNWVGWDGEQKA